MMPSLSPLPRPSSLGHDLVPCHEFNKKVTESPNPSLTGNNNIMTTSALVGVCITDERTLSRGDQSISKTDSVIGMMVIKDSFESMSISQLRLEMKCQIPTLPSSYIFVSSRG